MIRTGIIGATGYTGAELLRLLSRHPEVEVAMVTSRKEAGTRVDAMFPSLRGHVDLAFSEPDVDALADCDVVFTATPHGAAMALAGPLLDRGVRLIDLSADFRIRDTAVFERWYGLPHSEPGWLEKAVYGLPEFNREALRDAQLVACPGCYPTAVQLGFAPLLRAGVVDPEDLIADCKSGVSGAGKELRLGSLFVEANDSFKAYASGGHRHLPEIRQGLADVAGKDVGLTFLPHLVPMNRGIHASLYARLTADVDLQALFEDAYADEPFVDVMPAGSHPETRWVRGANLCRLAVTRAPDSDRVIVLSVIDNLTKGAAGQAVQCFNLAFGLDEWAGLEAPAMVP